ncbi:MAG: hypothetical protein FJ026_04215 [Chloroflexi bacterium]|nr:hypothetical protein [Chloroflexota bacterium]
MLVFKPRRSKGWIWLVAMALVIIGISAATVLPLLTLPADEVPRGVLVLMASIALFSVPTLALAAWFPTMRYELDEHTLTLRYGPVLTYRIPLHEIQTIRRRNLSISPWSSLRFPGIALFTIPYTDVGNVKMCATAAATGILLVETRKDKYGLTPADEEGLVAALRARIGG